MFRVTEGVAHWRPNTAQCTVSLNSEYRSNVVIVMVTAIYDIINFEQAEQTRNVILIFLAIVPLCFQSFKNVTFFPNAFSTLVSFLKMCERMWSPDQIDFAIIYETISYKHYYSMFEIFFMKTKWNTSSLNNTNLFDITSVYL